MLEDGKIGYIEMPGGDRPATKAFYGQAFGWSFTDYGPNYVAFDAAASGLDGGFDGTPDEAVKQPLPILYAHDLEAMLAKVVAAGAEIVRPIFSYPGGRRFHFRDPSGNELAVFTQA
jgi:uncharacterized protein